MAKKSSPSVEFSTVVNEDDAGRDTAMDLPREVALAEFRASERLARLQALTGALAQAVTSEQVADAIIRQGLAALDARAGLVVQFDGDELTTLRIAGHPPEVADVWKRFPLSAPYPTAEAVRTRRPVIVTTRQELQSRFPEFALVYPENGTLIALPMVVLGRVIGALRWSFPTGRAFDEQDQSFLLTLAELCGQALERTRLYEAERQARERAERAAAEHEQAEQTLRFLAGVGATLGDLLDVESTLAKVARLALPAFADWCVVDLVDEDGRIQRVAGAHADPAKEPLVRGLAKYYPVDWDSPLPLVQVMKTGKSALVPAVPEAMLESIAPDEEYVGVVRGLAPQSFICVPLVARDRVFGALGFAVGRPGPNYEPDDLALAEEIARRAAAAIDNARLYRAAREADRHKEDFMALVAHELRSPLAPLRNALQLLRTPGFTAAELESTRAMMERQVQHLTRLVEDLLDVSRIARGKIGLRKEPVELATVVNRAVETSRPSIDSDAHELTVTLPAEPVWLEADPLRLAQVLGNLLNNAAKYSERGGRICLTAEVCSPTSPPSQGGDSREGEVVIRIKDTGIGIAADMLPRIFEPFTQAERARGRSQGGLGLGLTLVRNLVDLHGGGVTAHSDGPGCGSEFVVRLPALPETREAPPRQAETPAAAAAGRRVLVVDDLADAANSLAALLGRWGNDVRVAYAGLPALAEAATFRPEVVFLDIGLPDLSGYDVVQRLRRLQEAGDVLAVAMTGYGTDDDRRRSKEAGFDHHLVKPIDPEDLRRLLAVRQG